MRNHQLIDGKHPMIYTVSYGFNHPFGGAGFRNHIVIFFVSDKPLIHMIHMAQVLGQQPKKNSSSLTILTFEQRSAAPPLEASKRLSWCKQGFHPSLLTYLHTAHGPKQKKHNMHHSFGLSDAL